MATTQFPSVLWKLGLVPGPNAVKVTFNRVAGAGGTLSNFLRFTATGTCPPRDF